MSRKQDFYPEWREDPPKPGSYRSIFKWGDPKEYKHPNRRLYKLVKEEFGLTDEDFKSRKNEGDEIVELPNSPLKLQKQHIEAISGIVGEENISTRDYDRLKYSTGKTAEESRELREREIKEVADLIVHPRNKEDVQKIIVYCNEHKIPVYVYGGGSTVNFGLRPVMGGITLVMQTHMNKIVELNERNHTCRVQAGMMGPAFEEVLNNAPEQFGTKHRFTGGHFPQSFEYSTVGGWIVTLGSGQQSSYFGDSYHLVIGQEWVTPRGNFETKTFIAEATGPKLNDIMKGCEGTFGVLVELTVKIFKWMPENQFPMCFIFPSWEKGVDAAREVSQGEFGMPGVFRLSDPEETSVALKLYGIEGTFLDTLMSLRGFKPMERCLLLSRTEGERGFAKNVLRKSKKVFRRFGGMSLTGYPVKEWEHSRYRDPYMREDLDDYGLTIDTLETSVTWENLHTIHRAVRSYVKSRPKTICMSHGSHFYSQGTNLYFIFFGKFDSLEEYRSFQKGIFDTILESGGSLSHHHGVGRMIAPWMEDYLGKEQMDVLRALKNHFDPRGIMNPGGQMGLDYGPEGLKNKEWRIDWRGPRDPASLDAQ